MAHLTVNFRSKALGMPVMLDVFMPQGRGGYKTLYLLHGAGGDHSSWVLNTRIADYVNNRNIAVVMPSGKNRFYINNEYGKKYHTYIAEELVSQCEKWFDISKKAHDRYIAGMSMGGYGAVYAALKNPHTYNTVFSYSGLLNILERYDKPQGIDMFPVFGTRQQLIDNGYDLYTLVDEYAERMNISKPDINSDISNCGNDDIDSCSNNHMDNCIDNNNINVINCIDNNTVNGINNNGSFVNNKEKIYTKYIIACGSEDPRIHMSRQFAEALTKAGIDNVYRESPGEHNFAYWDYCIEQTVKYICGEETSWQ